MKLSLCRRFIWHCKSIAILAAIVLLGSIATADSNLIDSTTQAVSSNHIDTQFWITREVKDLKLRFKLPKAYKVKEWAVSVNSSLRSFQSGSFDRLHLEVEIGQAAMLERAKVVRQRDYIDYKEWNELIGGHKAVIQTFQGGGIIFDGERQISPYNVDAVCVLDATRLLRVRSFSATRKAQDEVLAALRTIQFDDNAKQ